MLDPTSNMYVEKNGLPLNACEIRQEWFSQAGKDITIVVGREHRKFRKADLPIFLKHFDGFGDLTIEPDELDKYGFTAFIPNTDLMDSGFDYGRMFIVKDSLCNGTQWHTRDVPANPFKDPYFPIGQSAMDLRVEGGNLVVSLRTLTPNFERFEARIDEGAWKPSDKQFIWQVHPGANRCEVRTVNAFAVNGPVSMAEMIVK
jgi:hypothetical protein